MYTTLCVMNEYTPPMLCSVLIAALVAALVVVPFRPAPRLLAVAALALLAFWSRAPTTPDYGVIRNHVPLGTNKPTGPIYVPNRHQCWDRNENGICDTFEDTNGDGICNVQDCVGTKVAPPSLTSNYGLYVDDPPIGATTTYGIHVESLINNAKENLGELQKMQRNEDTIMAEIVRLTRETNQAVADCFIGLEAFANATSSYSKATHDLVSIWQTKPWYKRWFG